MRKVLLVIMLFILVINCFYVWIDLVMFFDLVNEQKRWGVDFLNKVLFFIDQCMEIFNLKLDKEIEKFMFLDIDLFLLW